MKLENWALVLKRKFDRVTLANTKDFVPGKFSLVGIVYESSDFERGMEVVTSRLVKFDEKIAITKSGSYYELGEMSKDYKNFLEACESEEIMVAKGINITKNGTFIASEFITGDYSEKEDPEICGAIIAQDLNSNILTLTNMREGNFKVYPDWLDIDFELERNIHFAKNKLEFCNYYAKLDLFGEHKNRVMPYA